MLPQFPAFKKLELSDQPDIEAVASRYEPYSDFNFSSMWSWDIKGDFQVSELNGNLVVVLSDHFSDEPFCSFIGNMEVNRTLKQLFAFSAQTNAAQPELRLVPEISLQDIDLGRFIIEIDLNNCDYIYDLHQLAVYPGSQYSNKRKLVGNFLRNYSNSRIQVLDLNSSGDQTKILGLNDFWAQTKIRQDVGWNTDKELAAIRRFLQAGFQDSLCVGVLVEENLIAYSIFTLSPNHYAVCHFSKADVSFYGVNEYLMRESAAVLLSRHCSYLNYEEDLGLPGLRFSKNSYKPVSFLRKYSIREA